MGANSPKYLMTLTQYQGRFTVDGLPFTSVSSIIKTDQRLVQGRRSQALANKSKQQTKTKSATARGMAVHSAVREFLRTGECELDPAYYDYFSGIQDWLTRLDLETWWAETPVLDELQQLQQGPRAAVWCEKHRYIGVPDWVGKVGGVGCVLEFKTSDTLYRNNYNHKQFRKYAEWVKYHQASMQVAAYANAWKETTDMNVDVGIIINSTPNECQLFIIEREELKKKLTAFHKLCQENRKIHG